MWTTDIHRTLPLSMSLHRCGRERVVAVSTFDASRKGVWHKFRDSVFVASPSQRNLPSAQRNTMFKMKIKGSSHIYKGAKVAHKGPPNRIQRLCVSHPLHETRISCPSPKETLAKHIKYGFSPPITTYSYYGLPWEDRCVAQSALGVKTCKRTKSYFFRRATS